MTTEISAIKVKELRELTGVGFMDCKKALMQTAGDIEEAIELMRKMGQLTAGKKSGRITAEGVVHIALNSAGTHAVMLEINCETDFVARDAAFREFVTGATEVALKHQVREITQLSDLSYLDNSHSVEETRQAMVAKIGENISLRRVSYLETDKGVIGNYLHGTRIGVLVQLNGGDASVAKDIAMHIAASNPIVVAPADVSAEYIEKEKAIYLAQSEDSGKPKEIIEKMVAGRINKYLNEVSLLGQPFVKDPNMTVADYLKSKQATVEKFVRYEVGEGIEKNTTDFVADVMAQVKQS